MISHIMLNLRTHLQESRVVTFGIHGQKTPGMDSSQMPSPGMASRPMGVTTVMALSLTLMTIDPRSPASQPQSMLNQTLERLGTPMTKIVEESDGEYEESSINLEMQQKTHVLPQDP